MAEYDEEFESVDSGASLTIPMECGDIKIGGYMVIDGRPCKVVNYSTAKTGKHGHAKASITAIDIFNGTKKEDSQPTSQTVEVPNIKRTEYQAVSLDDDGYVTLMSMNGKNIRSDLALPSDVPNDDIIAKRIRDGLENGKELSVTVLAAMDIEKIVDCKEI